MLTTLAALLMLTIPPSSRFLALGDSYTIGESVAITDRWPNQLARQLRQRSVPLSDPDIIAQTGWTTDDLSSALNRWMPRDRYSVVTLLIGVNNQYRGRDAEQYRKEFAVLLKRAIGYAGGDRKRVIVVSIPDWGVTPFAEGRDRKKIAAEIDRFNAINAEETKRAGAKYVDITPISRKYPALVAPDGLHPSAAMYAKWVTVILPQAEAALQGH